MEPLNCGNMLSQNKFKKKPNQNDDDRDDE